jgi:hypothetical protein
MSAAKLSATNRGAHDGARRSLFEAFRDHHVRFWNERLPLSVISAA